ncbi:MAG: FGGY family carbohydrate kinase, partial [Aureliella sp.]
MKAVLALDQGTTSSRALLFDRSANILSLAQQEFRQIYPQPGWVEHDPLEIWSSQLAVAREALAKANLSLDDIAAIGITNQRETTIVWDRKTGRPIANAIVWQDRRTAAFCEELARAGHAGLIQQKTGLVIDAYFSGSKIRWLLDNVPGARKSAEAGELAYGTVDSWLIWQMTEGRMHVTDVTNASRSMLFNLRTADWDDQLLELLDIPRSLLPEIRASSEVYGQTAAGLFGQPLKIAG